MRRSDGSTGLSNPSCRLRHERLCHQSTSDLCRLTIWIWNRF
jgi:hypothetical protein